MVAAGCTAEAVQEHLEGSVIRRIGTGFARRRRTRPGDNDQRFAKRLRLCVSFYGDDNVLDRQRVSPEKLTYARNQPLATGITLC